MADEVTRHPQEMPLTDDWAELDMAAISSKIQRLIRESAGDTSAIPEVLRVVAEKFALPALFLWVPNRDGTLSMDASCAIVTDPNYMSLASISAANTIRLGHSVPGRVALTGEVVIDLFEGYRSVGFPVPFPGEGVGCVLAITGEAADPSHAAESVAGRQSLAACVAGLSLALGPLVVLRDTRNALRRSSRRLHALTSGTDTVALVLRRDGVIIDATGGSLLGEPHTLHGCNIGDFIVAADLPYLLGAIETQPQGEARNLTFKVLAHGSERTVDAVMRDLRHDKDVNAYVLNLRDTTEQRSTSRALLLDSRHDVLTGLLNQTAFSRALDAELRKSEGRADITVAIVDINNFKKINDALGHIVADELLRAVAVRITSALPRDAVVARIDGDSFGVLFIGDAVAVEERLAAISRTFSSEFPSDTGGIKLEVTVGVATLSGAKKPESAETVIWQADLARFHARRLGLPMALFTPAMQEDARRRRQLEADLAKAADAGELDVVYQPLVSFETGSLVGIEALVRWTHHEYGVISPREFIPIAEHSGSMPSITNHVVRNALDTLAKLDAGFGQHCIEYVAVNLSAPELVSSCFIPFLRDELARTGMSGNRLALEITESVIVSDPDGAIKQMLALSEMGIRIDIDDFGTGYSSLTYLTQLPAHALKIDKAFVDALIMDNKTRITVEAIITLGHQLDLRVVVEGVEEAEQADWLARHGADTGQGYFFSHPLTYDELAEFLAKTDCRMLDL